MHKRTNILSILRKEKHCRFNLLVILSFCIIPSISLSSTHITSRKVHNITWTNGFNLIRAGELSNGFSILDSLFGNEKDPDTIKIQITNVFRILCPGFIADSTFTIIPTSVLFTDTTPLSSYKYKIIRNFDDFNRKLPSFSYNASFSVQKPFELKFQGLLSSSAPHLTADHQFFSTELDYDLIDQLWNRSDSITCTIHLDLKKTNLSIHDYITDYVFGFFDSIKIKRDLEKYHALSLRCYKRKSFGNLNGKFTAIIAFDRFFPDRKSMNSTNFLTVRYTVVVQAPASVCDIAESKFQEILKSL